MKTHFQIYFARLPVIAEDKSLRRSFDVQSSLGKRSLLFSSRVDRALNVGSSSNKSPLIGMKNVVKPRKASESKSVKKAFEGLSGDNDSIDGDLLYANLL